MCKVLVFTKNTQCESRMRLHYPSNFQLWAALLQEHLPTPRWEGLTRGKGRGTEKGLLLPKCGCVWPTPAQRHPQHLCAACQWAWCQTHCSQASMSQHLLTAGAWRINGNWEWIHCIFLEEIQAEESNGWAVWTCYQSPVCISSAQAGCQCPACFTFTQTGQNTSHDWCQCCLGLGWHVMLWKRWTCWVQTCATLHSTHYHKTPQ